MAKSLVACVKGIAKSWYASLQPGSVFAWEQLRDQLITNFQGQRSRDLTAGDLFAIE
jgi:hypothetical protein